MYIGIDIGGSNMMAALTDGKGEIINKINHVVDQDWSGNEICRQIALLARKTAEIDGHVDEIEAVGVGLPGVVDNKAGKILLSPNTNMHNTPFRALFQKEWDVPVYLGNDANCAAIGEYWAGAAMGSDPAVIVTLGTGIGGGMVVGGKLFTGFGDAGMEIGHMCIHPSGVRCNCGSHGCWEQYGSAKALVRMTREEMHRNPKSLMWEFAEEDLFKVTARTPFQAARQDDESAKKVLYRYHESLAIGLTNIVNILQPELLCLSGGVSNAEDDLLLDPVREMVLARCLDKATKPKIVKASLGNNAGVIGAAMLCNML